MSEEIKEYDVTGSCSIAIVYRFGQKIYCVRNEGLGIYLIDNKKNILISLCGSSHLPFTLKKNEDKTGFFKVDMEKIIPECLFEDEKIKYEETEVFTGGGNLKIVIGSM